MAEVGQLPVRRSLRSASKREKMSPAGSPVLSSGTTASKKPSRGTSGEFETPVQPVRRLKSATETLSGRRGRRLHPDVSRTPAESLRAVKTAQAIGRPETPPTNSARASKSKSVQQVRRSKRCRASSPSSPTVAVTEKAATPKVHASSEPNIVSPSVTLLTPPVGFINSPSTEVNTPLSCDSSSYSLRRTKRKCNSRMSPESDAKTPKLVPPRLTGQTYSIPQKVKAVRKVPDLEPACPVPSKTDRSIVPDSQPNAVSSQGNDSFLEKVITKEGNVESHVDEFEVDMGRVGAEVHSDPVESSEPEATADRPSQPESSQLTEIDGLQVQDSHAHITKNDKDMLEHGAEVTYDKSCNRTLTRNTCVPCSPQKEETSSQETCFSGSRCQQSASQDSDKTARLDTSSQETQASSQTAASEGTGSQETVPEVASSQETVSQTSASEDLVSQTTDSQQIASQETESEEMLPGDDGCEEEANDTSRQQMPASCPVAGQSCHLESASAVDKPAELLVPDLSEGDLLCDKSYRHCDKSAVVGKFVVEEEVEIEVGETSSKPPIPNQRKCSPASFQQGGSKRKEAKDIKRRRSSFIQDRISRPLQLTPIKSPSETLPLDATPEDHLAHILQRTTQETLERLQTEFPQLLRNDQVKTQVLEHVSKTVEEMKQNDTLSHATSVGGTDEAISKPQALREMCSKRWQAECEAWDQLVNKCEVKALEAEHVSNEAENNPITEPPPGFDMKSLRLIDCNLIRERMADVKRNISFMVHHMAECMKAMSASAEKAEKYIAQESQRLRDIAVPEGCHDPKVLIERLQNMKSSI